MRITICGTNKKFISEMEGLIKTYVTETQTKIHITTISSIKEIENCSTDICLIDLYNFNKNEELIMNWKNKNKNMNLVCISNNAEELIKTMHKYPIIYFILHPVCKQNLYPILNTIKEEIKNTTIIVKIPHGGNQRIYIKDLNYINIVNRCLRYHLDNEEIDSQSLRNSFAKETVSLLKNEELYFIAPSLMLNLSKIKALYNDHIIFNNGEILYYPKIAYANLDKAWRNYFK